MVPAAVLARFGLFVQDGFLEPEVCERLIAEMCGAPGRPATVGVLAEGSGEEEVDDQYRRTRMADVSDATMSLIENRLRAAKPAVEEHFSMPLGSVQKPQFLVYREGDFFRPHIDNADDASERAVSDPVARRRVSMVVFVNGGTGAYAGGALTLYGLLDNDGRGASVGIPVTEAPGLLVAFRSETLHSVTPVTGGERCSIVSWLGDFS
jgi:SM-20-related protein